MRCNTTEPSFGSCIAQRKRISRSRGIGRVTKFVRGIIKSNILSRFGILKSKQCSQFVDAGTTAGAAGACVLWASRHPGDLDQECSSNWAIKNCARTCCRAIGTTWRPRENTSPDSVEQLYSLSGPGRLHPSALKWLIVSSTMDGRLQLLVRSIIDHDSRSREEAARDILIAKVEQAVWERKRWALRLQVYSNSIA